MGVLDKGGGEGGRTYQVQGDVLGGIEGDSAAALQLVSRRENGCASLPLLCALFLLLVLGGEGGREGGEMRKFNFKRPPSIVPSLPPSLLTLALFFFRPSAPKKPPPPSFPSSGAVSSIRAPTPKGNMSVTPIGRT